MATATHRLQLANRIRLTLLRDLEHGIDVQRLLDEPLYARDVLLVCDAMPGSELASLAALFRDAARGVAPAGPVPPGVNIAPGHAQQANEWGLDTSGFGVSQSPAVPTQPDVWRTDADDDPAAPERRRNWLPGRRRPK